MSEVDEKKIERCFEEISQFQPNPEVAARDLDRARESLVGQTSVKQVKGQKIWRMIMKSRMTKLAAAAVMIIAGLVASHYLGGSIDGTTIVWARVIEAIENAHTITSRETRTLTCEGKELPFLGTSQVMKYASPAYGVREDMQKDGQTLSQTYWLLKDSECVKIIPALKQCTRKPLTEAEKRVLYQMTPDGVANLIRTSDSTELGRKEIDGVEVEGLEIKGNDLVVAPVELDDVVIRMWVDVKTYLPVVIEAEAVTTDKAITIFTNGKPVEVKLLAGEFQWDVELDPEIFEPNIPDDYTVKEQ